METIIPGFESEYRTRNEPGGGGPGFDPPVDVVAETCYEVMIAHISFDVETKVYSRGDYGAPGTKETGKWSIEAGTIIESAAILTKGQFGPKDKGQIYKECKCFNKVLLTAGKVAAPLFGIPINTGVWKSKKAIINIMQRANWVAKKTLGIDQLTIPDYLIKWGNEGDPDKLKKTKFHDSQWWNDQYIFTSIVEKCKCKTSQSKPSSDTCKCSDSRSVKIELDNTSTQYKTSEGQTITLKGPGDRDKVIKEVIAAEQAISLKCDDPAS